MKKKLIAIDMDGTLCNDDLLISEENLSTLLLAGSSFFIVPTTGRPLSMIPKQLKNLGCYEYSINSNGSKIHDIKNNKCIYECLINNTLILEIVKICKKYQGIGLTAHIDNQYYVEGEDLFKLGKKIFKQDADEFILCEDIYSFIKENNHDVEEMQLFFFDMENAKKLMEELDKYKSKVNLINAGTYCEIVNKNASKGNALKYLSKLLNLDKEDVYCFGDSRNDITMFNESGTSFALENAKEEIKKLATHVVKSNNDSGVAFGIKNYILNK